MAQAIGGSDSVRGCFVQGCFGCEFVSYNAWDILSTSRHRSFSTTCASGTALGCHHLGKDNTESIYFGLFYLRYTPARPQYKKSIPRPRLITSPVLMNDIKKTNSKPGSSGLTSALVALAKNAESKGERGTILESQLNRLVCLILPTCRL